MSVSELPLRVAALGGGTGLAALLSGLKRRLGRGVRELTGIVAVSDDGGSSGRLRRELGLLPPGDIRNCLVALADDEDLLARLFQFRFSSGEGLAGHSFGNLFLAALTELTGDFAQAILTAERILSVKGKILPATLAQLELRAVTASGRTLDGETAVGGTAERIERLELAPRDPPAYPPAVRALRAADLVVLGPGSLYTSILPHLLVPDLRRALLERRGVAVLVLNLMTQPGETLGFTGREHVEVLLGVLGRGVLDAVVVHEGDLAEERLAPYRREGAAPVRLAREEAEELGVRLLASDLVAKDGLIRHDPARLAGFLLASARELAKGPRMATSESGSARGAR